MPAPKVSVIECDKELFTEVSTTLQFAITGKSYVPGVSTVAGLVALHCPELFDVCAAKGFKFVPSTDADDLKGIPPDIRFDIVRI